PIVFGANSKSLALAELDGGFIEQRTADDVVGFAGANRVKGESGKNIQSRHLAGVLVAAITVGGGLVEQGQELAQPGLGFPGLAGIVVQVNHVVNRFVAMGV